jgi:hypothetical protein
MERAGAGTSLAMGLKVERTSVRRGLETSGRECCEELEECSICEHGPEPGEG